MLIKPGKVVESRLDEDVIEALLNECAKLGMDPSPIVRRPMMLSAIARDEEGRYRAVRAHGYWSRADQAGAQAHEQRTKIIDDLCDLLNEQPLQRIRIGAREPRADLIGWWADPAKGGGEGVDRAWEEQGPGAVLLKERKAGAEAAPVLLQGDRAKDFLEAAGVIDYLWLNDPSNSEGRAFGGRREHLDALISQYLAP